MSGHGKDPEMLSCTTGSSEGTEAASRKGGVEPAALSRKYRCREGFYDFSETGEVHSRAHIGLVVDSRHACPAKEETNVTNLATEAETGFRLSSNHAHLQQLRGNDALSM